MNLSKRPQDASDATHIVLKIPHATGLFRVEDGKTYEFAAPAAAAPSVTLLQLALPRSAVVDTVQGKVIERFERLGRLVITVAADAQTLAVYE